MRIFLTCQEREGEREGGKRKLKIKREKLCTAKPNKYSKVEGGRWKSLILLYFQHILVSATMKKNRTKKHYFRRDPTKLMLFLRKNNLSIIKLLKPQTKF